jgi:hypothetical protein
MTLVAVENRHKLLTQLHTYVESFAAEQADWYKSHCFIRQIASLWLRFFSLLFFFLGGLCPLLPKSIPHVGDPEPWGYALIGIGGGLLLFDRLFGISSSWMRFIWAFLEIEEQLDKFRMRWTRIQLEANDPQSHDTFRALVSAAEDAVNGIHIRILLETAAWRTEFQGNITSQMSLWKTHVTGQASTDPPGENGRPPSSVQKS